MSTRVSHTTPVTRGSTVRATLNYVLREGGVERVEEVLRRVPEERRRQIEALAATDEVPFAWMSELLSTADEVLREVEPAWVERAGAFAIESSGTQLYPGILGKASPLEFLTQPISLFRLYYQPGNMEVVEHEPGRAVLRLVEFDHGTRLFCRRQTGGLLRALELAGGRDPVVRHVRCTEDADAFCEWELRWS